MTPFIFTALMIYIPVYFEVHDMIQIRAAAASTFLLSSLIPLTQKRYMPATLLMLCAILFHYSAIVFLPFLFLGNRQLNHTWRIVIAILVPVCFIMYLLKKDWFSLIPESMVWGKINLYKETTEKGEWEQLYPLYRHLYFLAKCCVLYLCLYYYDIIVKKNRIAPLLINIFATSICFLTSMATIPVIAGRISDMFGIVDCIVFTFCLYVISPKYVVRAAIAFVGLYMIIFNMINTEYFT